VALLSHVGRPSSETRTGDSCPEYGASLYSSGPQHRSWVSSVYFALDQNSFFPHSS